MDSDDREYFAIAYASTSGSAPWIAYTSVSGFNFEGGAEWSGIPTAYQAEVHTGLRVSAASSSASADPRSAARDRTYPHIAPQFDTLNTDARSLARTHKGAVPDEQSRRACSPCHRSIA